MHVPINLSWLIVTNSGSYYLAKIDLANGRSTVFHFFFIFTTIDTVHVEDQTSQNANVDNDPGDKEVSPHGKFQMCPYDKCHHKMLHFCMQYRTIL